MRVVGGVLRLLLVDQVPSSSSTEALGTEAAASTTTSTTPSSSSSIASIGSTNRRQACTLSAALQDVDVTRTTATTTTSPPSSSSSITTTATISTAPGRPGRERIGAAEHPQPAAKVRPEVHRIAAVDERIDAGVADGEHEERVLQVLLHVLHLLLVEVKEQDDGRVRRPAEDKGCTVGGK